ncbi:MAG: hypothetical protein ACI4EF_12015 [Coprococcus sp.]
MKKYLKQFFALMMTVVIILSNINAINVFASEIREEDTQIDIEEDTTIDFEEDTSIDIDDDTFMVATVFEATSSAELRINEKKHRFSNASDGSFNLEYAEEEDYYIGSVTDSSTGVTYCLITYNEAFYLVVADGSSKYKGTYHASSFLKLGSKKYNDETKKISLIVSDKDAEYTTRVKCFHYNEDYSVRITGWYEGIYYTEGKLATEIIERAGNYDLFTDGKLVTVDGWYDLDDKKVKVANGHVSIVYDGKNCFKYSGLSCSMIKNSAVNIDGISYRFDKSGELANGIFNIRGGYYYYIDGIKFCGGEKKVGKLYYYFQADGKALTNSWLSHKNMLKYYDDKGVCSKIYYTDSYTGSNKNKYKQLINGKWSFVKKGVYEINGTYYLFKNNGVRYKGTRWYQDNKKTYYYVKNGVVLNKLTTSGATYKYYYNNNGKWKYAQNTWIPKFDNMYMKTDNKGLVTVKYYRTNYAKQSYQGTYWKYNGSSWKKTKKAVVEVNGSYYCLDSKGKTVRTNGWYTLTDRKAAYISKSGKVYKYVYYNTNRKYSIYKTGYGLDKSAAGLKTAVINDKTVYYYTDAKGVCTTNKTITIGDYAYQFDQYGIAYSKKFCGEINCDFDIWMKRVMKNLLGKTGVPCNFFVTQALRYAGGNNVAIKNAVKYSNFSDGGIKVTSASNCSFWVNGNVTADIVLSDGEAWQESKEYVINGTIMDFSYDNLAPGDIIAHYMDGDYEHVSMYLGQFDSAADVKAYLVSLGVSQEKAESCVRTWGAYCDNDPTYWCIHGGMGSDSEIYISNTCYEIPAGSSSEVATKIIKMFNFE